jgi:hypothetical protein
MILTSPIQCVQTAEQHVSTRDIKEANKERLLDFDEHGKNSATIYLDLSRYILISNR